MKKSILIFAAIAFIFGCSKKEELSPDNQIEQTEQAEQVEQTAQDEQYSFPRNKIFIDEKKFINKDIDKIDLSGYLSRFRKDAQNSAHSVYLNDEVEFSNLPTPPDFEKTLVAGNDLCVLFNKVPQGDDEFDSLKRAGIKIPKGALLKCTGEKIEEEGENRKFGGLFLFEENYNYFYPIEYEGKTGFVFGADVCGQDDNITSEQTSKRACFHFCINTRLMKILRISKIFIRFAATKNSTRKLQILSKKIASPCKMSRSTNMILT